MEGLAVEKKPYQVNPSAVMAQAPVLLRQLLLVAGGVVAVLGFLSTRDLNGLYAYLQSDEFVPVFVAVSALASLAYGQWKAYRDRVRLVEISEAAPDSVAVVTRPAPPPAVNTEEG